MNEATPIRQIKRLIAAGKTSRAIEAIKANIPGVDRLIDIIAGEYNQLRTEELKGVITSEAAQIRRNRIHDKLLELLEPQVELNTLKRNRRWILLPVLVALSFAIWWFLLSKNELCPDFKEAVNNKIIVLPFQKVDGSTAEPHTVIAAEINRLTEIHNLSTTAQIATTETAISRNLANELFEQCDASVVVGGLYTNKFDAIRVRLSYYFKDTPNQDNLGAIISSEDILDLLKEDATESIRLKDAILSLCGVIAIREGNKTAAVKWFDQITERTATDQQFLEALK